MTVAQAMVSCAPSTVQTTPITPALPFSATQASGGGGSTFALTLPPTQEILSGTIAAPAPLLGLAGVRFVVTVQPSPVKTLPSLPISSSALTRKPLGLANIDTVSSIIVTSSATISFGAAPVFTLELPANTIVAGATYMLAFYDPVTGWNLTWAGPATIVASTLTFASSGLPFALAANVPANFALLRFTATASPAPSPTAAPATVAVSITPNSAALVIGGSPTAQTLTVTQSGFAPTFIPTMACTIGANSLPGTVATIAAVGSSTASAPGAPVMFSVAVSALSPAAGTCTGSISSSAGGTAAPFTVTVTQTNAVIQSLGHR